MLFIISISMIIVCLMYMLIFLFNYSNFMDFESMSVYECGFDQSWVSRYYFSYRFFLISILFMIFDVEISMMLPIPFIGIDYGMIFFFIFIMILILGLMYEYMCGSLDWLKHFMFV